jgi:hypothetical protein
VVRDVFNYLVANGLPTLHLPHDSTSGSTSGSPTGSTG